MKNLILILPLLMLTGCVGDPADALTGPRLSPVGSGLRTQADPIPVTPRMRTPVSYRSTWDDGTDLYRDPRARRTGDVVTVIISMQDKAKLDNKTGRSRDSQIKFGLDWLMDVAGWADKGQTTANLSTNTQIKGNGQIDRTEDIKLSIAAIVTDVLPNGNMMISGSQEFRVKHRDARAQCRRHRASARYLANQHDFLRKDRGGARVLWWSGKSVGCAAAWMGTSDL
ncbi:flagellar L-ring protein precursor FlgH [Bradyrhizobium japonicum]